MKVAMIAAMGANRVIGKDNDLPWNLPDDFAFFKKTTDSHCVIMGRKNWESLPKRFRPLPNRTNIVITRQSDYKAEGAVIALNLEEALSISRQNGDDETFIIGGGEIYRMALPFADTIYLTEINGEFEGQTTFPAFNQAEWKEVSRVHHPQDERHSYSFDFVIYQRN